MGRKITLILLISFLALSAPLNVSAHATLLETSPEEGSQLKRMPDKVSLTFNERLGEGVFNLQVRNSKGMTRPLRVTNLKLVQGNSLQENTNFLCIEIII
ncbi:copper resistance protein CopC [Priestia flexa]|uniref:copper resistance CopC family protein n=1 Tax=Priestia flexa TaxID=86664 RepID=UPI003D29EFE2